MRHRSGFASESFMRSVIARAWSCHGAPPSSSAAALAFAPLPEINDAACSPEIGVTPKPSSDTRPAKKPLSHTRCSGANAKRSEEHTSELQSHSDLVCRLLLEKKKNYRTRRRRHEDHMVICSNTVHTHVDGTPILDLHHHRRYRCTPVTECSRSIRRRRDDALG